MRRSRSLAIPRTLDDITARWLSSVLRASVDSLSVESTGNGYAGSVGRVTVRYPGKSIAPSTLIAKLPSANPDVRRYAISDGMYRRETHFYQELAQHPAVPAPDCLYAELDAESGDFALLLEDLGDLKAGDELAGCSVDDAEVVVGMLGRLHATWWNDEHVAQRPWLPGPRTRPSEFDRLQRLYQQAWASSTDVLRAIYPMGTFEIAERLGPALASVLEESARGNHALNHGDVHLGNMFFRDSEVILVDWQNVMLTSPALDIAYFIQGSLPVETRRTHERDLLDLYLSTLQSNGVAHYSPDELIEDYRRGLLRTLIPSVLSVANLEMDSPESRELIETIGARMVGIADWDCGALIPGS